MMTLKDLYYIAAIVGSAGGCLWWLSAKISQLGSKMDTLVADIQSMKADKLAERVAVIETRLKVRRVK